MELSLTCEPDFCEWCEAAPASTEKAHLSVCQECAEKVTQCEHCGLVLVQSEGFASTSDTMRFDGLLHETCTYGD